MRGGSGQTTDPLTNKNCNNVNYGTGFPKFIEKPCNSIENNEIPTRIFLKISLTN